MSDQLQPPNAEDLLKVLEGTENYVALVTGLKQQFLDCGWSNEGAETLAIQMLNSATHRAISE
jgi:hypothetical protein